jgi:hypothetical protein
MKCCPSWPDDSDADGCSAAKLASRVADNDARFVAPRILQRQMNVAVYFHFHRKDSARERIPIVLAPGSF